MYKRSKKAKEREIENLRDYETMKDEGQKKVGSRWVVTKNEKSDGQKIDVEARIVAKGFHEEIKPQADSPTAMKESFAFT